MVSKQDIILKMLEKIDSKTDKHGQSLSGMEQHLSTLNGTVVRHEKIIDENRKNIVKNKVSLTKLVGPGLAGGGLAGVIIYILQIIMG